MGALKYNFQQENIYFISVFLFTSAFFGKRPSSSCIIMLCFVLDEFSNHPIWGGGDKWREG